MSDRIISWRELVDCVRRRIDLDPEVVEAVKGLKQQMSTSVFRRESCPTKKE